MLHMSMQTTRTGVPPGRGGPGQPVRGVIGGAALHLPQQPLPAVQVKEAGVPPVREHDVLPGLRVGGEPRPAAAVLIDAQVRHRGRGLVQQRIRRGGERIVHHRPGDPGVPGRLRRGDPPLGDLSAGLLPQPGRDPAPRRQGRHPLGERLARAFRVAALPPDLDPPQVHRVARPAHVPRPGQHRLMHPARDRAALRARRRGRVIRDRPYLQHAARPGLHVGNPQALHPEQRRRRILEHDARGFLVILKSVAGPKIVGAAGSQATATRPYAARSGAPGRATGLTRSVTPAPHPKSPDSDSVPANFEEPAYQPGLCVIALPE